MTGSAIYLRRLAILGAGILLYWLLLSTLPRTGQGVLLMVHGLAATGVGAAIAYRRWQDPLGIRAILCVSLILITWGLGELGWSFSFFLYSRSNRSPSVVLITELAYFLSFVFGTVCMLSAIESRFRTFFIRWIALIPLLLTSPVAFRLILDPFLAHRDLGITAFNLGETMVIAASYIALNLALLVLLSTRFVDWSIFAAGILCLVFGDWSIRLDKITGHPIEFALGSFFILFGLYSSSLPFLWRGPLGRIQHFQASSILNQYRIGLLVAALSMVLVYALFQRENIYILRVLCLGSSGVAFVAVFLSQIMVERIQWFGAELGQLFRSGLQQDDKDTGALNAALPVELQEIYRLVFTATIREQKLREEQHSLEQRRRLQAQVAHDIRSPLAALSVIVDSLPESMPEDSQRMLKRAAERIRDIANDLIESNRSATKSGPVPMEATEALIPCLLSLLVEEVVSEKRIQYSSRRDVEIDTSLSKDTYGLFAAVQERELKRGLSNLINNSVEAIADSGKVTARITAEGSQIILSITDNGKGIPDEILTRLGERGFTHGKAFGSGLGLHHACSTVALWGGSLSIQSSIGAGTNVEIRLPAMPPPSWFADKIELRSGQVVAILDDDKAIHATWDSLLTPYTSAGGEVVHFTEARLFRTWLSRHRDGRLLCLVDYELLRQEVSGLDIIEQEEISERAILVTSRFSEPLVLQRVSKLGLRVIPKGLVGQVPIIFAG
jgi:signal transduction histidine kinase